MIGSGEINAAVTQIHAVAKDKGFWDKERNIGELLMLVVTELAEALEAHRGRSKQCNRVAYEQATIEGHYVTQAFEMHIKDSFNDEICDTVIRLFDLCGGLGIDLEWHMKHKLEYNKTREKLHGKKY